MALNETPSSVEHKMLFTVFIVLFTTDVWSLLLLNLEQRAIDVKVNNDIKAMEGNQSQQASQRAKRKSCTAVCYVEPGLRRYNTALIPSSVNCSPLNQASYLGDPHVQIHMLTGV